MFGKTCRKTPMKTLIQIKTTIPPLLILLLLVCFAFMQKAQATDLDSVLPNGNTAEGSGVLVSLTSGVWNSGFGFGALNHDTAGKDNTATGVRALFSNTSGSNNTATGVYALYGNSTGWYNSAVGAYALSNNTIGTYNTANGYQALNHNTIGTNNTANGVDALVSNTTGSINTAIGVSALLNNSTGNLNTALGGGAGNNVLTASNVICIGASGADVSNTIWIANIYNTATISAITLPVVVSNSGQLGTAPSSARFKKEIKPIDKASETILALKPVTFHYKSDTTNTPQFGLIAEEVAEVNPDLVVRDENGEIYTVRYDAVNAMLLNEFLKEHGKVEKLEAAVAQQRKDFQSTIAQLEASKPAPQVVNNP